MIRAAKVFRPGGIWAAVWSGCVLLTGAATAGATDEADAHARHHMQPGAAQVHRSTANYQIPDINVVREDGRTVNIRAALDAGGPVLVGFIFTTCTAICPITSATFQHVQERLAAGDRLSVASISIDPEQDTPARLREYAAKFDTGARWHYYTGTVAASIALQRAFDAYRGDKMDHTASAYLRAAPGQPWVRIDGFASADQILAEYRAMTGTGAVVAR